MKIGPQIQFIELVARRLKIKKAKQTIGLMHCTTIQYNARIAKTLYQGVERCHDYSYDKRLYMNVPNLPKHEIHIDSAECVNLVARSLKFVLCCKLALQCHIFIVFFAD